MSTNRCSPFDPECQRRAQRVRCKLYARRLRAATGPVQCRRGTLGSYATPGVLERRVFFLRKLKWSLKKNGASIGPRAQLRKPADQCGFTAPGTIGFGCGFGFVVAIAATPSPGET